VSIASNLRGGSGAAMARFCRPPPDFTSRRKRLGGLPMPAPPLVRLAKHEDPRASMVSIAGERDVPFAIARVYYIFGCSGAPRGFHAHRALEQLMICVSGSCRVILDDGEERSEWRLDTPDLALTLAPMVWHEMHDMTADTVLLVLASAPYDEGDYIRDYDEFISERSRGAAR
jgi:dTDP-4-dehydrorhamnose 3,5-epimerase-like enzyme